MDSFYLTGCVLSIVFVTPTSLVCIAEFRTWPEYSLPNILCSRHIRLVVSVVCFDPFQTLGLICYRISAMVLK